MDTNGVRRGTAPPMLPYARGSLQEALKVAGSRPLMRAARRKFRASVFAPSSKAGRAARLRTVRRLLKRMALPFLPVTPDKMERLTAALMAAKYRSTMAYLARWKEEHVHADHAWNDLLVATWRDCKRAAERGLGPPRQADTFRGDDLQPASWGTQPLTKNGPVLPGHLVAVGVFWLLREAELASLLREQASVDRSKRTATLDLCATKMDPGGRGCERTLRCSCQSFEGACPYCCLAEALDQHEALGFGPKHPLFPTLTGRAPSEKSVLATIRKVSGLATAGRHSLRRVGAKVHTRRFLPLYLTQFLGRWGGNTVARYVGEELQCQTARQAAHSAAHGGDGGGIPLSLVGGAEARSVANCEGRAARHPPGGPRHPGGQSGG